MSCVLMAAETGADITEDAVLGGRLRLRQLSQGHRVGHDAILLAAACPVRAGERAADLGAGVGAAGLALARRVEGARVTLVEMDARLAALAGENAALNRLSARVNVAQVDVMADARALESAGLHPHSFMRVLMNPPFNDPARQKTSPDGRRRRAHAGARGTLQAWVAAAARLLRPSGTLSLIWRADRLEEALQALHDLFGATTLLPIHPKPEQAAIRVLVRATRGSHAPLHLLPGFVLADETGGASAAAEAVLRQGAVLPLAQV
jgi:tRNA1(Val) A37 N6-methylase TrmN6